MWSYTGVPSPPSMLMNSSVLDSSVTVTWGQPMDMVDIARYQIEYRISLNQPNWTTVTVNSTVTSYKITGLSPMVTYEVRVFAISIDGISSVASDPITITTTGTYVQVLIEYVYYNSYYYSIVYVYCICYTVTITGMYRYSVYV